jgi:hypothetical protein
MDERVEISSHQSQDLFIKGKAVDFEPKDEKKLVRKISWIFIPFLAVIIFLQVHHSHLLITPQAKFSPYFYSMSIEQHCQSLYLYPSFTKIPIYHGKRTHG